MKNRKMLIFDMDGTLLDSSISITKSINFVRKNLKLPPLKVKQIVKLINEPDNNLPKLFYEEKKPYSECKAIFEKHYYKQCIKDMQIHEGIKEALKDLNKDYMLSVATNAYGQFARKMLKHLKIHDFFVDIIGSDDINARKPEPNVIFYLLKKYNIEKNNAMLIGDSLKDEECAKNADIKYIFVDWGFGESREPDHILSKKDLPFIKQHLKNICNTP